MVLFWGKKEEVQADVAKSDAPPPSDSLDFQKLIASFQDENATVEEKRAAIGKGISGLGQPLIQDKMLDWGIPPEMAEKLSILVSEFVKTMTDKTTAQPNYANLVGGVDMSPVRAQIEGVENVLPGTDYVVPSAAAPSMQNVKLEGKM